MKRNYLLRSIQISLSVIILLALLSSSLTVRAQGLSFPAEINKSFTPISIAAGGISRLSITVFNPNSFQLTNAAWADNLIGVQPGISIANPVNLTNSCGGTVTAVAGATSLSLSGGTIPAQVGATPGSCTVEINVTSTTPGNLINTIPAGGLTSTGAGGIPITNTTPASATLRVGAVQAPSLSKSFTPNTVWVGETSRLAIVIRNNDLNTALTQASITDNLPPGLILATPVSPTLTNCGAATLTAVSGTSVVTLSNSTIAPNTSCAIRVNVIATTSNVYNNTIPATAVQTQQGVTNASPAAAALNVQNIGAVKAFSPTNFQAGGTSTLTITLQNPTGSAYTGVNISDTLPVVPNNNLTIVAGSAATTCGGAVAITPPGTVNLTGGTIPAGSVATPGTCTITVQVNTPAGAPAATYANTIPAGAMTTTQGATNIAPATANVSVYATGTGVTGTKSFTPATITAGDNSMLRITINAPADTNLTNFSITDNLPVNVTVSNSTPAATNGCGAPTLTVVTGATSISLTNGTILVGTPCTIDIWVTSSITGTHTNIIPPANITNTENRRPANDLTADLTVQPIVLPSDLSVSKAFTPPTVGPNGISTLTITLQNTNSSPLVNVSLSDTLPGGTLNGVVVAPIPNASTTCGAGVITAVPGGKTVQLTNGSIPAQIGAIPGVCTINVDVQGKGSAVGHTNTIPIGNVTGEIQGTGVVISNPAPATARLDIANLSIAVVKGFNPLTVFGGSSSTLTLELVNPNNALLTGVTLTDNMPAGMIIANPANLNVGTCGGTLTGVPGAGSFSFSGGSLPAATSCTLTLSVTMTVNGNLTNTIPANAVTTLNGANNSQAAAASLTNLPGASVSKAFSPNPIAAGAGNFSSLTITIQNTGNIPLTGMGLSDNLPGALPAGLEIAGAPAPAPVNNCGGTLTAVAGTQNIQLTNGALAGTSSCTIVVSVTSSVPGSYLNTIPVGALTNNQGATNTTPATDRLVVTGVVSGLTKIISSTNQVFTNGSDVAIGEIVTYQVGIVIPPGTYTNANLVDTMERGLAFLGCDTINAPGLTTSVAGGFASICANPTVDDAGGGTSADVDRRATFGFGTVINGGQADATITVTYRAMVIDIAANVDGVSLNNSAVWNSSAGSIGPVQTTVNIIEPDLSIAKTANVNFIANGSTATFSLVISHTAASNTDAFDVVVTDVLPAGLDYVANSIDCDDGEQDPDAGTCVYDAATRTIRAQWSAFTRLPAGDRGIIRLGVVGNANIPPNGSVTNTANVEWTSIPGNQTVPQSFSAPPNQFATERFYDPADPVNFYSSSSTLTLTPLGGGGAGGGGGNNASSRASDVSGFVIPLTGFTPNTVTELNPGSRQTYNSTNLVIEIPVIKVNTPIVGVPLKNGNWDISWLQDQAGWLNGTAYPTWTGNSVLTAHAVNADGKPGVFSSLKYLKSGEYIFVYNLGYRYTYQVVSNKFVQPDDITVLKHEDKAYLTLITCDAYNEKTGTYLRRIAVRAVLVDVREVK